MCGRTSQRQIGFIHDPKDGEIEDEEEEEEEEKLSGSEEGSEQDISLNEDKPPKKVLDGAINNNLDRLNVKIK